MSRTDSSVGQVKTAKETVTVRTSNAELEGNLTLPDPAKGIVVFAHGSGSSRFSPRNQFVADKLNEVGLATLLFDLLTSEEDRIDQQTRELRFDIDLLTERMVGAIDWVGEQEKLRDLSIGLFGASTGAAAALRAAAQRANVVSAIVSRGGRPDLAESALGEVQAPTLLIVGGYDTQVIELNRRAAESLTCDKQVKIVPEASHLFEEPGKLMEVAELAQQWFTDKLS